MKGSFNKSYECSLIVNEAQIRNLVALIKEGFPELRFMITTYDGAIYSLDAVDDLFAYTNSKSRQITKLSIVGNKEKNSLSYMPDVTVSIFDKTLFDKSLIVSLNRVDEQEISYYSQRLDEFVNNVRVSYWWMFKHASLLILSLVLYAIAAILCAKNLDVFHPKSRSEGLLIQSTIPVFISIIVTFLIYKLIRLLYPEGGFEIGEQAMFFKKKANVRNIVWISVIVALVIGVVSNVIAHYLVP